MYYAGLALASVGFVAGATVFASLTLDLVLNTSRLGALRDPEFGWRMIVAGIVLGITLMLVGGILMCVGRLGSLAALFARSPSEWISALEPWGDLKDRSAPGLQLNPASADPAPSKAAQPTSHVG